MQYIRNSSKYVMHQGIYQDMHLVVPQNIKIFWKLAAHLAENHQKPPHV